MDNKYSSVTHVEFECKKMAENLLGKQFDDFDSGTDFMKKYFYGSFHLVKSNG